MAFCLPKEFSDKMITALKEGRIVPEKLINMSSKQRRTFLEDIVGKENAKEVNAQLEAKLILKDQKKGLVSWAKKLTGITEQARRDLLSKIERLEKVLEPTTEKAFLEDLVSKRLGTDVTIEEAKTIAESAKQVRELKEAIPPTDLPRSDARIKYGTAEVLFRDYVDALKLKDPRTKLKKFKDFVTNPKKMIFELAGLTKSLLASLDNSFFGRQGIKVLYNKPTIWAKDFIKSFGDIVKELRGIDAITPIKADVFSRPNALNGKYEAGKYDLGIAFEEAFPSSVPAKIPIFGRVFKAAESAFNGGALRMRADLADNIIRVAEKQGIDALNPVEAIPMGKLINSMTGRGSIGKLSVIGGELNVAVFSIKFLKSNIDFLTAHVLDKSFSPFAKKQAAFNLMRAVASVSAILWTAEQLFPGSVETDAKSADFGKIRIGNTRFDITGGMSSLIILAIRLGTGKSKSATSGRITDLGSGKWGSFTRFDVINNFWSGKLSPLAGAFRDFARARNFEGDKPTVGNTTLNLITPIPFQTFQELQEDPESADLLLSMILEGLGISANTYGGN